MKISMVSEHASPLATLGGVDAGGQNVHVAALSAALAEHGHDVTVYTRRDDPGLDERVVTSAGYTVVHVPAGPATSLPKTTGATETDELLATLHRNSRQLHNLIGLMDDVAAGKTPVGASAPVAGPHERLSNAPIPKRDLRMMRAAPAPLGGVMGLV
jgi:pyridoxine 5'-phosphate synthase PdxJ